MQRTKLFLNFYFNFKQCSNNTNIEYKFNNKTIVTNADVALFIAELLREEEANILI